MKKLRQTALAAAAAVGVGAVSMPSYAVIEGTPAEGLLVPFVFTGYIGGGGNIFVDTYIGVETPREVGQDAIPNTFTAPNTTPTNNLIGENNCPGVCKARWYFFDVESKHQLDGPLTLTNDDIEVIVWSDVLNSVGRNDLVGVPGYLVIGNESARIAGGAGDPNDPTDANADFAMFGEAQMVFVDYDYDVYNAAIPTLGMIDSDDAVSVANGSSRPEEPDMDDGIKYTNVGNVPSGVSPLVGGMRIANGDGIPDQVVGVKMNIARRDTFDNLMVLWLDRNHPQWTFLTVNSYDEEEGVISDALPLPYELNLLWCEDTESVPQGQNNCFHLGKLVNQDPANSSDIPFSLGDPSPGTDHGEPFAVGWVEIILPETTEDDFVTNAARGTASSSGVGFTISMNGYAVDYNYDGTGLTLGNAYIEAFASDNASELGRSNSR
jgi:hypothetical protein